MERSLEATATLRTGRPKGTCEKYNHKNFFKNIFYGGSARYFVFVLPLKIKHVRVFNPHAGRREFIGAQAMNLSSQFHGYVLEMA
jgi:hypothetical protein